MLLAELARTSQAVAGKPRRLDKVCLLAAALRSAEPAEVAVVVSYLSGELLQRRTGVGWATLRDLPATRDDDTDRPTSAGLTVLDVDAAFDQLAAVAGPGSAAIRQRLVRQLFGRATADEQRLLAALVGGELRQGAQAGLVVEAVAKAAGVPGTDVRRALTLRGDLGPVAQAALGSGLAGLGRFRLEVGRGLSPMLAQPGDGLADAMARTRPAVVDYKLDGVRIQVHRDGDAVTVFTRTLDDVTARLPEIVAGARALPVDAVVLDGEALALRPDGWPHPFQVTAARAASGCRGGTGGTAARPVAGTAPAVVLSPYFFDVLHLDGRDLLDEPLSVRADLLANVVPEEQRAPRLVTDDEHVARAFSGQALAAGHEGVVVKALDSPYEAGRRGSSWLKVKPRHTLDLVVLAAEWGHGRRRGWLSNLHLGARDPGTGGHVMLGKTFKGLTDELLRWQTERLLELAVSRDDWQVVVRPELVVEVAFDGVQTSVRYPGGVALRFARVLRYREDKPAAEADTIGDVRRIRDGA